MSAPRVITLDFGTTTWTVPEGMYWISNVYGWSGGGGTRGGISLGRGSGGGGSGMRAERTTGFAVLPGDVFTVEIGAGGNKALYNSSTGVSDGGLTRLTHQRTGTVLIYCALGGTGSTGAAGGAGALTTGSVGDILTAGNAGVNSGTTTGSPGGNGGTAPGTGGGAGGLGGDNTAGILRPSQPGSAPGGGAGGGDGNSNNTYGDGNVGGAGQIVITGQVYEIVGIAA